LLKAAPTDLLLAYQVQLKRTHLIRAEFFGGPAGEVDEPIDVIGVGVDRVG